MKKPHKELDTTTALVKELAPLATQAESLSITNPDSLKVATSLLSRLNKLNDDITEEKEKVTRPLNEALEAERSRWKPAEQYYKTAIEAIRLKMTEYQTNLIHTNKVKEESITSRIAPGKGNLSFETAVKKLEELPTADKTTSTEEGSVTFVEKKILKVTDLSLIPDEYWLINEPLLLEDLKKGLTISGAELDTIFTPRNIR